MILEILEPIPVILDGRNVDLQPGQRIDLPDDKAHRLLSRAPGKARLVGLEPGTRIEWESPLFSGRLCGELLAIQDNGDLAVFHPRTDALAMIAPAWVCATSPAGGSPR